MDDIDRSREGVVSNEVHGSFQGSDLVPSPPPFEIVHMSVVFYFSSNETVTTDFRHIQSLHGVQNTKSLSVSHLSIAKDAQTRRVLVH